jgi:hypothetical protein
MFQIPFLTECGIAQEHAMLQSMQNANVLKETI